MQELRTIILAAGKGTRMKSSTPKVLHEVCGKPIIQYVLDVSKSVGSTKTYVVIGHKNDAVKEFLSKDNVKLLEQKKQLGTADAVKVAARNLSSYRGDVLILCGDTPLLQKDIVKEIVRKHRKSKAVCTILTAVVHNPQGYGRVIKDEQGNVVAIREDKDATGLEREIAEINVGVYCFKSHELLKALKEVKVNKKKKEFYLTDIIELLFTNGLKIETLETEDSSEGLGINTREDLAKAESTIRYRILKKFMDEGVTIRDPSTTYISFNVKIGKDTVIRPHTFIEDNVRIGNKCTIGPFARIRPESKIGDNVEVGNFTEVSRTKIGNRSFMKHFSFLGDSIVGTNVNIGAGTVTANFDGVQKNVTKIDDYAFVGSDSVLIAPVKVGKRAIVGAGSVVPSGKSIPDDAKAKGVPVTITLGKKRS